MKPMDDRSAPSAARQSGSATRRLQPLDELTDRALARLWRRGPPDGPRAIRTYLRLCGRPAAPRLNRPVPIRMVGMFEASHGIGAAARMTLRALEKLGAWVEPVSLHPGEEWNRRLPAATQGLWIFHMNPPELAPALAALGPRRVVGPRYAVWAWELPRAPASWLDDAWLVDEVWAPSRYVADSLAGARAPVRVSPHPLLADDYANVRPAPRAAGFQVVALFDFNSSAARKNPAGAIAAFRRAFGDDPECALLIKTQNSELHPNAYQALRALAGGNVQVLDARWTHDEVKAFIAGADVLLSLHRAEGFGLTLAEALLLGTPVVATAATGVLDFLDDSCAELAPWRPTPVSDPQGIYQAGQTWADPDVDAAAAALRRLRSDPQRRSALAAAGRRRAAERLSPDAWLLTLPPAVQAAVALATGRQARPS